MRVLPKKERKPKKLFLEYSCHSIIIIPLTRSGSFVRLYQRIARACRPILKPWELGWDLMMLVAVVAWILQSWENQRTGRWGREGRWQPICTSIWWTSVAGSQLILLVCSSPWKGSQEWFGISRAFSRMVGPLLDKPVTARNSFVSWDGWIILFSCFLSNIILSPHPTHGAGAQHHLRQALRRRPSPEGSCCWRTVKTKKIWVEGRALASLQLCIALWGSSLASPS